MNCAVKLDLKPKLVTTEKKDRRKGAKVPKLAHVYLNVSLFFAICPVQTRWCCCGSLQAIDGIIIEKHYAANKPCAS